MRFNDNSQLILEVMKELKKEREKLDGCYKDMIELVSCTTSEDYYYQKGRVDVFEEILNIIGKGDFE